MKSLSESGSAGTFEQPAAIVRTIVLSVLISAGVLLLNIYWGRPETILVLLLALLLAFASGVVLMRLLAAEKQSTLAALWKSLVLAAAGLLLLVLLGRNDWLMMLPGIIIGGIGLGSASQVTTMLLQPLTKISLVASVVLLICIGITLSVALLVHVHTSAEFAISLLIDLLFLGVLVARIAELDTV